VTDQSSIEESVATNGLSTRAENKASTGWQAARGTRQMKMDEKQVTQQSSIGGLVATDGLSTRAENKARTGWQAARGTRQ
jgi:hypothetical protein